MNRPERCDFETDEDHAYACAAVEAAERDALANIEEADTRDTLVEAVRTSLANVRSLNAVRPTLGQLGEWEALLVAALDAAGVQR